MPIIYTVQKKSWFTPLWELQRDGKTVGTLRMIRKMTYSLAEAKTSVGNFEFGYKGWNSSAQFIRDEAGNVMGGAKANSWWNGEATLRMKGREYLWKPQNWWGSKYSWCTPQGEELMRIATRWALKGCVADIECGQVPPPEDAELLMLFGLYKIKMLEMESATVSTASTAAIISS
jgi:hypothetical protein